MKAVSTLCRLLPTPAAIKHILQPLLMSLHRGPHIALAIATLAQGCLSSRLVAAELLPCLVAALVVPASAAAAAASPAGASRGSPGPDLERSSTAVDKCDGRAIYW